MCGRFNVTADPLSALLMHLLDISYPGGDRFNIAPTETVPVLRQGEQGGAELVPMRWWLTPFWAKKSSTRYSMFNAKSESAARSPAFREPYRKRRCVVPISGFYEWAKGRLDGEPVKLPYLIRPAEAAAEGGAALLLAGLWDRWRDPEAADDAPLLESFTILTTAANPALEFVHHRQPVMLSMADARRWLDMGTPTQELEDLYDSLLPMTLEAVPVSTFVNNARNDGERCVTPVGDALLIGASS